MHDAPVPARAELMDVRLAARDLQTLEQDLDIAMKHCRRGGLGFDLAKTFEVRIEQARERRGADVLGERRESGRA